MSGSWVILCPGQGAQTVGMGRAWHAASDAARDVFDRAHKLLGGRLGSSLSNLCFEGPTEILNRTDVAQPAIYVTSMACWAGWLAGQGIAVSDAPPRILATAGLSLGEYTALCIAGAFSFEDGLELVALRGQAMQEAADSPQARAGGGGAMLALIGATDEQAAQICEEARGGDVLVCANYNAPGQIVISGHKNACDRGAKVAESMGLRSAPLAVAGAFHSPLMAPAAERLAAALARTSIRVPRCPVVANVTGRPYGDESAGDGVEVIRRRLAEQLTSPVRWSQSCAWMAGAIKGEYHELAPGKALAGLMRRIDKGVKVQTHEES